MFGRKTPTTFTYATATGLVTSFTHPKSDGGSNTYAFVWDVLGNIQSETMPGNSAVASKTTTQNYTVDGSQTFWCFLFVPPLYWATRH